MYCNEVVQVLVNNTIVVLICAVANCGIRVRVDFRFFNPESQCQVNEPGESGSDHDYRVYGDSFS